MNRSVDPTRDFYEYANGGWARSNPLPSDKSIWGAFGELLERNFILIHRILDRAASDAAVPPDGPLHQVGRFYRSAMDTSRLDGLGFRPLEPDRGTIDRIVTLPELVSVVATIHSGGQPGLFESFAYPDFKNSSVYALYLVQGGLALPDRDYYLAENFAELRVAYLGHLQRMLRLFGQSPADAEKAAATVFSIETELAKSSRTRTELRDLEKNYNRVDVRDLVAMYPNLHMDTYLNGLGAGHVPHVIVGQPEFLSTLDRLLVERPLSDWRTYLVWNLLHANARYLHEVVESEDFGFFHRTLLGQSTLEPRWRRASQIIDTHLGEALGQLFVDAHFPPEARERMDRMIHHLRAVFHDRLQSLDWMTDPTRQQALAKFDRFVARIGHPDAFRDYSAVHIAEDDLFGNVRRAASFDVRRRISRLEGPVDRGEWGMTPPTVNAYYDVTQNQIFFPAGILQPPFFDFTLDDAVNYGGIGAVIGHEITHGYDDQGRKSDAEGNLRDWWTEEDAKEFRARAQKVVDLYHSFEPLPGVRVNGELTLGENIADLGGVSLAYEALQRRLREDPASRREIDGLTPEQRFFISWAQIWRTNCSEPEQRRRLTIDTHAPGPCRAVAPVVNLPAFAQAFPSPEGASEPKNDLLRIW